MPAIFLRGARYQGSLVDCFATWLAMVGGLRSGDGFGGAGGVARGVVGRSTRMAMSSNCREESGGVQRSAEKSVVA